jgi:BirA family biotin operon repressor/biotin-[acetyl-CoA-carboxylase] ligase
VAVAEVIERISAGVVFLKWPNDVWLEVEDATAKAAGILVTSSLRGDSVDHALVGVGINVLGGAHDLPSGATSIQEATGVTSTPDEVLQCLLECFAGAYAAYVAADGRPALSGWLVRAALLGEIVTVEDAGRSVTGTFLGVDDDGGLLIEETAHKIRKVVAGDLVRGPRAASHAE